MDEAIIQPRFCRSYDLPADILEQLASEPDHIRITEDRIYLMIGQQVFCFSADAAGRALAFALAGKKNAPLTRPANAEELYERIIRDPDYLPDAALLKALGAGKNRIYCAAVFRSFYPLENDLHSVVASMAPLENHDAVIPLDYQTAVIVKILEEEATEDMAEFTEAVIGTMEAEGFPGIRAGIGQAGREITDIRSGYREAMQALGIGMRYRKPDRVFIYEKQTLERIVDAIPEERKKEIRQSFSGHGSGTLSEEMLETVRVFFRNDLNITAAAKQLFIHRNTLNYRLDKIRKDTGLDLRAFQDAAVFRILSEIMNEA